MHLMFAYGTNRCFHDVAHLGHIKPLSLNLTLFLGRLRLPKGLISLMTTFTSNLHSDKVHHILFQ